MTQITTSTQSNPLADDLDHVLGATGNLWEELRGKKIFITGGTGFFGCWLLESFIHANARLGLNASATVLTRNPDAFRQKAPHLFSEKSVNCVTGDVRTFDFPEGQFSYIIHAATDASARLNTQDPFLMFETIVEGTKRVLEFSRRCETEKLLLTSSGAVYGRQPSELMHVPEEFQGGPDSTAAQSAYGEGKRVSELLCAIHHERYGLKTKIARCFAFVGPYLPLDIHFAIGNFIRDAMTGGPVKVKGDGTPFRSYMYAADLAIWLWTILFKGEACRPYNVGSEYAMSIGELAFAVAECVKPTVPVAIEKTAMLGRPPQRYVPSIKRASSELGLKIEIQLDDAIKRTIAWYQYKY